MELELITLTHHTLISMRADYCGAWQREKKRIKVGAAVDSFNLESNRVEDPLTLTPSGLRSRLECNTNDRESDPVTVKVNKI